MITYKNLLAILISSLTRGIKVLLGMQLPYCRQFTFARQCAKMNAVMTNSAGCEIWSVIGFLNAKEHNVVGIHRWLCDTYKSAAMSEGKVMQCCRQFKDIRSNLRPPYSPDLASSDCHFFWHLKNWLASIRFEESEELKMSV